MGVWRTEFSMRIFIFLNRSCLISQNSKKLNYCLGAGIGTHVFGNVQAEIYDLFGSLYNEKNLLSLGACIQKRSNSI